MGWGRVGDLRSALMIHVSNELLQFVGESLFLGQRVLLQRLHYLHTATRGQERTIMRHKLHPPPYPHRANPEFHTNSVLVLLGSLYLRCQVCISPSGARWRCTARLFKSISIK